MKKSLLILLILVSVICLWAADFTYNGYIATRGTLYNDINPESHSTSYIDSRLGMGMEFQTSPDLKAIWKIQVGTGPDGYVQWGNSIEGGGIDTRGINLQTIDAYIDYHHAATDMDWKVGLQYWNDHNSLVWDDDFAAIITNFQVTQSLQMELGYAKLEEGPISRYDDTDLYMVNAILPDGLVGFQNLILANRASHLTSVWLLPYFVFKQNAFTIDIAGALNFTDYYDGDYSDMGYAFSAKGSIDVQPKLGFDILVTSGSNYDNSDTGSAFYSISEWYNNGLTIFGRGTVHEDAYVGWHGPGNVSHGLLSLVGTASSPMWNNLNMHGAVGFVSAMNKEDTSLFIQRQGKLMGIEINAGIKYNLAENLEWDSIGALGFPGQFYELNSHSDANDPLYQLSSKLTFTF